MENRKETVYIGIEHIHPHPENPRKSLGDLGELAESLKKNGCMQNLTVVPVEDRPGEYYALIGNRRHGAAKLAGIAELPCRVVEGMGRREQLSTMLEENMQRNDLTVYEQAQGFQLMLDLGETEETIAEKTGFSRGTVRHRLNIAGLDQEELKKKEQDDCFQLTLKDLYELEKVKDVRERNRILKESRSSRDLAARAKEEVAEAKRAENAKAIAAMLEKLGAKKAPKEVEGDQWGGKWKRVEEFDLDKDVPEQVRLPEEKGELLYLVWYRSLRVIVKAPEEKKELSPYEQEKKRKDKAKRQIRDVLKESSARRKEFIQGIISGKTDPVEDEAKEKDMVWEAMLGLGAYVSQGAVVEFVLGKGIYEAAVEERKQAEEEAGRLSALHKMLAVLHSAMERAGDTFTWDLKFDRRKGDALLGGYDALKPYGWYFSSWEEKAVLDGTHGLFEDAKEDG